MEQPASQTAADAQAAGMQTIIQANLYRLNYDTPEFLLLKRIDEDDRFWQPVSQVLRDGDDIAGALQAAVRQQAGVSAFKKLSPEIYTYEWYAKGQQGRDIVFSAEVAANTVVTVDSQLYSTYAWLPFSQAVQQLKWDGNKQALRRLRDQITSERLAAAQAAAAARLAGPSPATTDAPAPSPAVAPTSPVTPPPSILPPEAATTGTAWPAYAPQPAQPPASYPYQTQAPAAPFQDLPQAISRARVIPLPIYAGPDAPPPPPLEQIPGNQQAPDIPLPPRPPAGTPNPYQP